MQHLPFPTIEFARNLQQVAAVGASDRRRKLGLAAQLGRGAPDMARLADPLQPLIEGIACERRRRMDAPRDVGEGDGQIAPEDFGGVAAEEQQPGGISDQGGLARLEHRFDRGRRAEPARCRPQQHGHRR
jgi:hypothetical protein